jgi:hypothetical protein
LPQAGPPPLACLTPEQRAAATSSPDTPLLILAGPGSGKTATSVARVAFLAGGSPGVAASRIAVLTYTKAAAGEFRERLGASLGKRAAAEVTCGTFHSFCLGVCRVHAAALGRSAEFILYGEAQSRKVAAAAAQALGLVAGAGGAGGAGAAAAGDARAAKAAASRCAARLARHKAAGDTPASLAAAGNAEDAQILQARTHAHAHTLANSHCHTLLISDTHALPCLVVRNARARAVVRSDAVRVRRAGLRGPHPRRAAAADVRVVRRRGRRHPRVVDARAG